MKRQTNLLCLALLLLPEIGVHAAASIANEFRPRLDSRDGNSVDTATGAFIQEINLVSHQGIRSLDLDLSYNSLLTGRRGSLGYGWTHQYEARVEDSPATGVVTVYVNGNIWNQFQRADIGQPYIPLREQNRYDVLERFETGQWKLRQLSGTAYVFDGSGKLEAILDRNAHAVFLERYNGEPLVNGDKHLSNIQTFGAENIWFSYRGRVPFRQGPPLLSYLSHGDLTTFLKYDDFDRLSRIYDPVVMSLIGRNSATAVVPTGPTGVLYPISVSSSESNRLIRIFGTINGAAPNTLSVSLVSPQGTVFPITFHNEDGANFYVNSIMDDFLEEIPGGTWNLRVIDNVDDGITHTVNPMSIYVAEEAANWTQYDYEPFPSKRISQATDNQGQRIYSNTYDNLGRIAFQDDGRANNGIWRFFYEKQPNGDLLTTVYDRTPQSNPTHYLHDSDFHLKRIEDALGNQTLFRYDSITGNRIAVEDARGNASNFSYDSRGLLTTVTGPNHTTTRFGHDEFPLELQEGGTMPSGPRGNLTSVEDALKYKSTYTYDEFNNFSGSKNALEFEQSKVYEGEVLTYTINKGGAGIEYGNTGGRYTSAAVVGESHKEKVEYDAAGRVIKLIYAEGDPEGDPSDYSEVLVSTTLYDNQGNIVEKRNGLNQSIVYQFDHRSRLISEKDPEEHVTRYEYDGNGNTIRVIDPLDQVTQFEYDGEDRLIRTIDPSLRSTRTRYDAVGRVIQTIDELGDATNYAYDEVGNQTAVFNSAGVKISEIVYN